MFILSGRPVYIDGTHIKFTTMPQLTISNYQLQSAVMEPVPGSGNVLDLINIELSGTPAPGETWRIVHLVFVPDGQALQPASLNQETLTVERFRSGFPSLYFMIIEALGPGAVKSMYVDYDPAYARVDFVVG